MLNKDQSQEVSGGSTAIQAGGNVSVINVGVTASEARAIALDVAKSTFYELSGTARELASYRVEEITDKVIEKLEREFPEGLQKAIDPDFQYALLTVQKQYARNGDKDLGDLLVDLLVDRSKQDQRDILQIVLNESLETAPKLTEAQLSNLATIFLLRYTQNQGIGNHQMLGEYFDLNILPFSSKLTKSNASYQHLEFAGCGTIQVTEISLEEIFYRTYPGIFLKGFDSSEIHNRAVSIGQHPDFFIPCLNDQSKIQVRANNKEILESMFTSYATPQDDRHKISLLFDLGMMSHDEIRQKCIDIRPYMASVFDIWNTSPMKSFTLTSVGIAIGHANIKRLVGEFANLSIWIN